MGCEKTHSASHIFNGPRPSFRYSLQRQQCIPRRGGQHELLLSRTPGGHKGQRTGYHDYPQAPGDVASLAFSPDGRTLALGIKLNVGDQTGETILWDRRSQKVRKKLPAPEGSVTSVAFSRTARGLPLATIRGSVRVWGCTSHDATGEAGNLRGLEPPLGSFQS